MEQRHNRAPRTSECACAPSSNSAPWRAKARRTIRRGVRFMAQLAVIVAVYAAGCALASLLPIQLPGNVVGMVLLLTLLGTGLLKVRQVGAACNCLLNNMSFFFIPAGVGILGCVSLLEGKVVTFALVCVLTTIIVFVATSYTVVLVSRLMAHRSDRAPRKEA